MRPLSYANVTSTLALVFALGGVSYAAVVLPHDSVGSRQIRAGAVGGSEIRNGAVAQSDLTRSLRSALAARTRGRSATSTTSAATRAPSSARFR